LRHSLFINRLLFADRISALFTYQSYFLQYGDVAHRFKKEVASYASALQKLGSLKNSLLIIFRMSGYDLDLGLVLCFGNRDQRFLFLNDIL